MLEQAVDVLRQLGIYPYIGLMAASVAAIFVYRYFTDK